MHNLILVKALNTIAKSVDYAEEIINTIHDDDLNNPDSEYWLELWDLYQDEYDSIEDLIEDKKEDYMDQHGDTGYFFEKPKRISNDTWLVHFTKTDPTNILTKGFKGADIAHIGLTQGGGKRLAGHYALAYDLTDLHDDELAYNNYGNNLILFKAKDAVKAYHKGDDEDQVIFNVKAVKKNSMFGFERIDDEYNVFNNKGDLVETRPAERGSLKPSNKKPKKIPF